MRKVPCNIYLYIVSIGQSNLELPLSFFGGGLKP